MKKKKAVKKKVKKETVSEIKSKDIEQLSSYFNDLVKAKESLDLALANALSTKSFYESSLRDLDDDKLVLMGMKEKLDDIEKDQNKKEKRYKACGNLEKVKKEASDIKRDLEVAQAKWEQEKVDFEKYVQKKEQEIENKLNDIQDKNNLLNNKLNDFNKWKKKYGKIEEFVPF